VSTRLAQVDLNKKLQFELLGRSSRFKCNENSKKASPSLDPLVSFVLARAMKKGAWIPRAIYFRFFYLRALDY
jgi:hypothetical protein